MRLISTTLLMMFALLSPAAAVDCYDDAIMAWSTPDGDDCHFEVWQYVPFTIYIVADFEEHQDPLLSAGFQISNWPDDPDSYTMPDWNYPVTGDLRTGLTFHFDPPLEVQPGLLPLGEILVIPFSEIWETSNLDMILGNAGFKDIYDQHYGASQGRILCNWNEPDDYCFLTGDWNYWYMQIVNVAPDQGAEVLGDYTLDFTIYSWVCFSGEPDPFTGEVLVNGEEIHVFEGAGTMDFSLPMSTGDMPPGTEFVVEIAARGDGAGRRATLHYTVTGPTGVEDEGLRRLSISALKSTY